MKGIKVDGACWSARSVVIWALCASAFKRGVRALRPQSATRLQNHLWGPDWNLHLAEQSCGGRTEEEAAVLLTFSPGGPIGPWGPIRPWKKVKNICYWNLQFGLFYHFSTARRESCNATTTPCLFTCTISCKAHIAEFQRSPLTKTLECH